MGVGDGQRAAYRRKFDEAFRGKTFTVEKEINLPPGQVFKTMFGNTGRHGYIIRDTATGIRYVIGAKVLTLIKELYHGVVEPPGDRPPG